MVENYLDNNRYRIIRTLGSGGFGDTFLAEDVQMPSGRRCVIKQLKPVNNNPQVYQLVQERFQREAAILEELGEGNSQIPRLYAYLIENGEFYLIQEWVEGETLSQKVSQSGRLSESSVKEILVNILPVLDYVHGKRIVHRDIKPDNIILRHRDNQPVLIDFGAVRETMGTVMTTGGNATSSIVIGTPGYMPSEQSAGRPVYSSDLYSLGLTAVYLLTGKMPQELETDYHTGEVVWHRYALNVSPTLSAIIDKAIQSHPRDRYPTARDMLNALRSGVTPNFISTPSPTVASINSPGGYSQPKTELSLPTSPGAYQQPVSSPTNSHTGEVQKAAIIGSIIGSFILVGIVINKLPLFSTSSSTPSPTTSPTTSQSTAQTQPVNSLVSEPPSNSQGNLTNTEPPKPKPQPLVPQPSPGQTVKNYYANINQGDRRAAWNQLSPQLRNNPSKHEKGYDSYLEWWNQVRYIDINNIDVEKKTSERATVIASFRYSMKSGNSIDQTQRLSLVWNPSTNNWMIDDIERISSNR